MVLVFVCARVRAFVLRVFDRLIFTSSLLHALCSCLKHYGYIVRDADGCVCAFEWVWMCVCEYARAYVCIHFAVFDIMQVFLFWLLTVVKFSFLFSIFETFLSGC